jgi:hypothetical protein
VFQSVVTAPSAGTILEGLMVIVPGAGTSLLVTPGLALIIDPDGQPGSTTPTPPNPDDSVSKLVHGLGVPLGALPWTPNGGGGIRVDVVEIQRSDVVTETDNRDIFNPATGLFTAVAVTKVTEGEISYRIRLGTPGGGLPPPALGWLPIAILATPVGAPDLDSVEVWDVRNLASDVATPGTARLGVVPQTEQAEAVMIDVASTPGSQFLSGYCVRSFGGQRFGGALGDIGAGGGIDLALAKYREAGFPAFASLPYYVYCAFPNGYVRWVRYYPTPTATVGGRVPGFLRGFIVVSQTPANNGLASVPIVIPAAWGVGGVATFAVALATGAIDPALAVLGSLNSGDMTRLQYISGAGLWQTMFGTIVGLTVEWPLIPAVNYPVGARRVKFFVSVTTAAIGAAGSSIMVNYKIGPYDTVTGAWFTDGSIGSKPLIQSGAGAPSLVIDADMPVGGGLTVPPNLVMRLEVVAFAGSVAPPAVIATAIATPSAWDDR